MKIDSIILYNFGSYEGETVFNTHASSDKNIILIGGKNGAGKTTLFTAMRLCLYGYMSMGYKNKNSYYTRAITKLINNSAKRIRPATASIKMHITLNGGRGPDSYILSREWVLSESLSETFSVKKNGVLLNEDEIADFEKFVLSLIPPELFNLYFFDGERIADFFLDEGSNTRIKEAFLTLCGYDTFDIMRRNFKRIGTGSSSATPVLEEYVTAKEELSRAQQLHIILVEQLKSCMDDIEACEAEIKTLEKEYYQKGGITQEEWNQKLFLLKEEEKKRETWNALLRKWANELIPFLMIREQIVALKQQIERENSGLKYRYFCEVLEVPAVSKLIAASRDEIKKAALKQFGDNGQPILDLSIEQSAILLAQINHVLEFEKDKVAKCKRAIKRSLNLSAKIRQELDNSSITSVQDYMKRRAELFEEKSLLLVKRVELEQQISEQSVSVQEAEKRLSKVQTQLEDDLKKASISDISARAIIMLDKLQEKLYRNQIEKVEEFFRQEIRLLMRKTKFIDDIRIDDNFGIHIYRTEEIPVDKLYELLLKNSEEQLLAMFGPAGMQELKRKAKLDDIEGLMKFCTECTEEYISLPTEIDKTSLSNGEKQIFIMALYHSLVQLGNHEIPFVIDTPFARIDTEHRRNISKHFFSKLKGQVFILSTNEEINTSHVQIMNQKIAATYLLENTDNKRTMVVDNQYFEV